MASHHPETHGGISKKIKQEKARKRERERAGRINIDNEIHLLSTTLHSDD
jgi:hypothetical protein